jgi:rhodanese-related sulfurtransferase
MNLKKLIQDNHSAVIDVRSRGEFMGGHVAGSVNIPLQEITTRVEELKQMKQPLVVCCASGNRSGQAARYLLQQGIECVNGGSWMNVNSQI